MSKKYDVFISYRRGNDGSTAKILQDKLNSLGYHVFFDIDSLGPGNFNTGLYSVIDECTDFLLILSPGALDRCQNEDDWVRSEIEHALEKNLNIIPIILKGFSFPQELPPSIDAIRYKSGIEFNYEFFDAFTKKLQNFLISSPITPHIRKLFSILFEGLGIIGILFLVLCIIIVIIEDDSAKPNEITETISPEPITNTSVENPDNTVAPSESIMDNDSYRNLLIADAISFEEDSPKWVLGKKGLKRSSIATITFLNTMTDITEDAWDVSAEKNRSIMAWIKPVDETQPKPETYDLYIAAKGSIEADSCNSLFACYDNVTEINFNHCFYTDQTTDMSHMFYKCSSLKSLDVSGFNTSLVTNMRSMFDGSNSLETIDLSNFNTSLVTDMSAMFVDCSSLNALDLSNFDTTQVTNMCNMFGGSNRLQEINLSSFSTIKVTDMSFIFNECNSLREIDLSGFVTNQVTNMRYMFANCSNLNHLDLSDFNTSLVENMSYMFNGCSSLKEIDLSSFVTSRVKDMSAMFANCYNLKNLDLSNFNTSQVTTMFHMFGKCNSLESVNLSSFNTSQVTDMSFMFDICSSLNELDLSSFDTSLVTNMGAMFQQCSSLKRIDLSGFNTRQVTNMGYMFFGCSNFETLDLHNFDMSQVTKKDNMLFGTNITAQKAGLPQ